MKIYPSQPGKERVGLNGTGDFGPNFTHKAIAVAATQHVFLEKAMATSGLAIVGLPNPISE